MTITRLVVVALGHARRRPALSVVALVIAALANGSVVYLIGDTTQRNNNLLASLRTAKVRSVIVRAKQDRTPTDLLPASALRNLAALPAVERAVALSKVKSATVAGVQENQVAVGFFSGYPLKGGDPYRLVGGRPPQMGEAIVSLAAAERLRLNVPTASELRLDQDIIPTVGTYETPDLGAITDLLNVSTYTAAPSDSASYFALVMVVSEPADVRVTVEAVRKLLAQFGSDRYTVEYEASAADVQAVVANAGRSAVRSTALAIVLVAALMETAVAFVNALLQRREIARRRALGFGRSHVLAALIIEGTVLSAVGASVGAFVALALFAARSQVLAWSQPLASIGFITFVGVVAAIPAGALAAYQDPARILRVP